MTSETTLSLLRNYLPNNCAAIVLDYSETYDETTQQSSKNQIWLQNIARIAQNVLSKLPLSQEQKQTALISLTEYPWLAPLPNLQAQNKGYRQFGHLIDSIGCPNFYDLFVQELSRQGMLKILRSTHFHFTSENRKELTDQHTITGTEISFRTHCASAQEGGPSTREAFLKLLPSHSMTKAACLDWLSELKSVIEKKDEQGAMWMLENLPQSLAFPQLKHGKAPLLEDPHSKPTDNYQFFPSLLMDALYRWDHLIYLATQQSMEKIAKLLINAKRKTAVVYYQWNVQKYGHYFKENNIRQLPPISNESFQLPDYFSQSIEEAIKKNYPDLLRSLSEVESHKAHEPWNQAHLYAAQHGSFEILDVFNSLNRITNQDKVATLPHIQEWLRSRDPNKLHPRWRPFWDCQKTT